MKQGILRFYLNEEAKARGIKLKVPREADAGFDLPSLENVEIPVGGFSLLSTGVHLAIPLDWVGLLKDRSSVALRGGCITAGVIDASYRGEVKVAMHNLGQTPLQFEVGERIAQCVIVPCLSGFSSSEVSSLAELGLSERGADGFGSTGK